MRGSPATPSAPSAAAGGWVPWPRGRRCRQSRGTPGHRLRFESWPGPCPRGPAGARLGVLLCIENKDETFAGNHVNPQSPLNFGITGTAVLKAPVQRRVASPLLYRGQLAGLERGTCTRNGPKSQGPQVTLPPDNRDASPHRVTLELPGQAFLVGAPKLGDLGPRSWRLVVGKEQRDSCSAEDARAQCPDQSFWIHRWPRNLGCCPRTPRNGGPQANTKL